MRPHEMELPRISVPAIPPAKEWDASPIHAGQMRENSDVLPKGEPLAERLKSCHFSLRWWLSVFAHPFARFPQRANYRVIKGGSSIWTRTIEGLSYPTRTEMSFTVGQVS
jgi:hypothetical protein